MWSIGDIVQSKITGNKIKITGIKEFFIVGYLVDFKRYPLDHHLRVYTGFVILSYKNIVNES